MTSPTDILREHGEWIESTPYLKLVAKKLGVSKRQAYRSIKADLKAKSITKVTLPNRTVLYGLRNWPLKTIPYFKKRMKQQPKGLTKEDLILWWWSFDIIPSETGAYVRKRILDKAYGKEE